MDVGKLLRKSWIVHLGPGWRWGRVVWSGLVMALLGDADVGLLEIEGEFFSADALPEWPSAIERGVFGFAASALISLLGQMTWDRLRPATLGREALESHGAFDNPILLPFLPHLCVSPLRAPPQQ